MKKLNLTFAVALTTAALFAAGAGATGFDPISDADFIGDGMHLFPDNGRSIELSDGPDSDAEWGSTADGNLPEAPSVDVGWDPIADADFLGTNGAPDACTLAELAANRR